MSAKKIRIQENDRVVYNQFDLFDNSLLDKLGTVVSTNSSHKDDIYAEVFFDEVGLKTVPISCLAKVT